MTENATPPDSLRIVVLISGSGTNLQALIDAQPSLPHNARIVLVLSNRKAAYGLIRAQTADPPIPTAYLALQTYLKAHPGKTREDYDGEVAKIVLAAKPDLVVLAGWMHVLSDGFLDLLNTPSSTASEDLVFPIPAINLHPALPGAFDGAHAIDRAWEAYKEGKIDHTGVMVHRVVRKVDAGEPILTQKIFFEEGETQEQFEERLHRVEWEIIVNATKITLEARWNALQPT